MHSSDSESEANAKRAALQAKLAALKADRASALEAATPNEDEALEAEVSRAERELAEARATADARRVHGNRFATVSTPLGLVILKRSGTAAYRKLQDSEDLTMDDFESFVRPCVIFPGRDELDKLLADLPGAIPLMVRAISALMGAQQVENSKK